MHLKEQVKAALAAGQVSSELVMCLLDTSSMHTSLQTCCVASLCLPHNCQLTCIDNGAAWSRVLSLQQVGKAAHSSACLTAGLHAAMSSQAGSDFDDADEIAAGQAGKGSSTAAQLANSKAQQSLATSGFDDDALMEDDSLGGLQGSGTVTGQTMINCPSRSGVMFVTSASGG